MIWICNYEIKLFRVKKNNLFCVFLENKMKCYLIVQMRCKCSGTVWPNIDDYAQSKNVWFFTKSFLFFFWVLQKEKSLKLFGRKLLKTSCLSFFVFKEILTVEFINLFFGSASLSKNHWAKKQLFLRKKNYKWLFYEIRFQKMSFYICLKLNHQDCSIVFTGAASATTG